MMAVLGRVDQRVLRRADFLEDSIHVLKRFIHGQGVHLASLLKAARLDEILQIMPGSLDGQRIGNNAPRSPVIFHPCWMRESEPDRLTIDQKFYVYGICMAGSDGHDKRLVQAVEFLAGPAVGDVKVLVHS